jgi:methyl-accepting chemotaxis protein
MTFRTKILCLVGVAVLSALGLGVVNFFSLGYVNGVMTQTDATNHLIKGVYQVRMAEQEFVEKMTPAAAQKVDKQVAEVLTGLERTRNASQGDLEAVKAGLIAYQQTFQKMAHCILELQKNFTHEKDVATKLAELLRTKIVDSFEKEQTMAAILGEEVSPRKVALLGTSQVLLKLIERQRLNTSSLLLFGDVNVYQQTETGMAKEFRINLPNFIGALPTLNDKKLEALRDPVSSMMQDLRETNTKILPLYKDREELRKRLNGISSRVISQSETVVSSSEQEAKQAQAKAGNYSKGLVLLVIALLGGLGIILYRSITRPVKKVVENLSTGSQQLSSTAGEIATISHQLAESANAQAASIQETSGSMEEIAAMTQQNSENARQANSLVAETFRVIKEAGEAMATLTGAMDGISGASGETGKIIKTIDEIAFQTNLLALNAAVEAARAGEAGAGFAVVANEVRSLAMRATEAAKNTADLIEDTITRVKEGTDLVHRTAEAFSLVEDRSVKVKELVGEIAAASQEQAQGVELINRSIIEMDKMVQQNAANAEESSSTSEQLGEQADQMKLVVEDLVALVGGTGANHSQSQLSRSVKLLERWRSRKDQKVLGKHSLILLGGRGTTPLVAHEAAPPPQEGASKN